MGLKMFQHQFRAVRNVLSKSTVFYSTNENTKSSLIKKLSEEFSKARPLILKLEECDQMNVNYNEWKTRIDIMRRYHFSDVDCFKVISEYPSILEIPLLKFEDSIQHWQLTDLGVDFVKTVLQQQPILLEVEKNDIRKRIPHLRSYFGASYSLSRLLINSPNVMYDNWEGVIMKINYLLKERRFNPGDITVCSALSRSLDFIKFRFELLEKCGIYKQNKAPIHKMNKYDKTGHVNPFLKDILVLDPVEFIKLAKISQEEYQVYNDLFLENEDVDTDTDSDDD